MNAQPRESPPGQAAGQSSQQDIDGGLQRNYSAAGHRVKVLTDVNTRKRLNGHSTYQAAVRRLYGHPPATNAGTLPPDWRERLPDPATYYANHLDGLHSANGDGWAACRCPFHEDRNASASANLKTGAFRCHGCEAKGDLVAFHERITSAPFKTAVLDLIGGAR